MTRNIDDYASVYETLPFEHTQADLRRKTVLDQIKKIAPKSVLEIGCGQNPIFTNLPDDMIIEIVEPSKRFCDHAVALAKGRKNTHIHNAFFEGCDLAAKEYDLILLSSLLHEVEDPARLLETAHKICSKKTIVHINVPNAHSMHRLLGRAMNPAQAVISQTQGKLQQHRPPYDMNTLIRDIEKAGFAPVERGEFFIKPFTHAQMQHLMDTGFLTQAMLEGLSHLAAMMPGFGSEIWVNAQRNDQ